MDQSKFTSHAYSKPIENPSSLCLLCAPRPRLQSNRQETLGSFPFTLFRLQISLPDACCLESLAMEFRVNDTGECQFQAEGLSMRRVGLRRPRDHNERLGESGVCFGEAKILELACDGKDSDPGMIHGRRVRLMATGKTSGLRREGKGAISASRPELVFFVQALLSFVGIVVIPARLSYEFLIVRSHVTDNGSQQPGSSYAPWVPDVSVARHQNVNEPPRTFARIILEAFKGDVGPNFYEGGRYGDSSLERTSRRSGSRVLMQTDEEDEGESFTYTARTKFYLCSDQSVALNEDELRGNITNIFGVDEVRVSCYEGSPLRSSLHKTPLLFDLFLEDNGIVRIRLHSGKVAPYSRGPQRIPGIGCCALLTPN